MGLQEGAARGNNVTTKLKGANQRLRSTCKVADFLLVHCPRASSMRVSLSTGSETGVHFIGIL